MLLDTYLKQLKLPTIIKNYEVTARQAAEKNLTYEEFLCKLLEQEIIQRDDNNLIKKNEIC